MKTKKKIGKQFVAIEGGEGSGKSTILRKFIEKLSKNQKSRFFVTREPGGSPFAEIIRNTALKDPLSKTASSATMLCLMFGSRFDSIEKNVMSAIKNGKVVISDRVDGSSYAYNVWAQGKNGELDKLFWALREQMLIKPNVYIYFEVDAIEGNRRANLRRGDGGESNHFDQRKLAFHERVREGYERFFSKIEKDKLAKVIRINANLSIDQVLENFEKEIGKLI